MMRSQSFLPAIVLMAKTGTASPLNEMDFGKVLMTGRIARNFLDTTIGGFYTGALLLDIYIL